MSAKVRCVACRRGLGAAIGPLCWHCLGEPGPPATPPPPPPPPPPLPPELDLMLRAFSEAMRAVDAALRPMLAEVRRIVRGLAR